ncbi:MAG: hypothetical protein WAL74_10080 [Candidatus Acidiferrales bacterium]
MPIDDPVRALKQQFELENLSKSPVSERLASLASALPLPYPFDKLAESIKGRMTSDALERIELMLEACIEETQSHAERIANLQSKMDEQQAQIRRDVFIELVMDAARKAENTRSKERVKRIGTILANAAFETKPTDSDEIEEMMRVAMDLADRDVELLRELVRVEGEAVLAKGRIERYDAHTRWEIGSWGTRLDPELDSVFSKLESYGLVSRIAPPNNLNIMADAQNRYVLLWKGARFAQLIRNLAN